MIDTWESGYLYLDLNLPPYIAFTQEESDYYLKYMDTIQLTSSNSRNPSNTYSGAASRWTAVTRRDPCAVGSFVYAVRTTGIYCQPNCSARLARRANILFYDNAAQAEANGFRACKRCKPNLLPEQHEDSVKKKIHRAVEIVQEAARRGEKMSLSKLSQEIGLSKWHLQRVFKRENGVSPREMSDTTIKAECAHKSISPISYWTEGSSTTVSEFATTVNTPLHDNSIVNPLANLEDFEDPFVLSGTDPDDILRDLFPDLYNEE